MHTIRIGIAQINSTVGDLSGNTRKIMESIDQAKSATGLCFPPGVHRRLEVP